MNVLIINYKFPPDPGVASFRVAKFAKYLTEFGCNVHVLTRDNGNDGPHPLMDDIAAVDSIVRTDVMSDKIPLVNTRVTRWIKPMIVNAERMIEEHDIDVVLHSAPAHFPLVGCMIIKRRTGIPYIVDLRDPLYTGNLDKEPFSINIYKLALRILEPKIIQCASAVVFATETMRDVYIDAYPSHKSKIYCVENGYDPEDYDDTKQQTVEGFQIVFPGKFRDDMRWFFEPFSKFVNDRNDIRFIHFGDPNREEAMQVREVVEDLDLGDYVSFEGYVTKDKVLSTCMNSNLGLVVSKPNSSTYAGAKTYDYIGCDIPILGVDDGESAMRDILVNFPNAYATERSDSDAIYETLVSTYENKPSSLGNSETAEKYTRRNLTQDMFGILQSKI